MLHSRRSRSWDIDAAQQAKPEKPEAGMIGNISRNEIEIILRVRRTWKSGGPIWDQDAGDGMSEPF